MTTHCKLLFDECIGIPLVQKLRGLIEISSPNVEIAHALELGFGATNDDVWIPAIASDGWVIVTGDRGARPKSGKGEKLPIVCRAFSVTHVMFSAAIGKRNAHGKLQAVFDVWQQLIDVHVNAPRGSGFSIRSTGTHSVKLVKLYDGTGSSAVPKRQTTFLWKGRAEGIESSE